MSSKKNSMEYYWVILLFPAFFGRSHGDCGIPPRLEFAELDTSFIDQESFSVAANVTYKCRPGFISEPGTKNILTCLSDSTWSTPETFCKRRSCGSPGDILNGKVSIIDTLFGSRVNYTCDPGYKTLSRRNFRDCLASGLWSNEVPVCEAQKCPPPDAITDGSFQPDQEEYEYLQAVVYECNDNKLALIGEKTLSCTANGNWSSDPPNCKVVECSSPDVKNAVKLSGFTGPYILNSAVRFACSSGYTMTGNPSVTCNINSEWEPPLPTCSRVVVTPSPATTKEKATETGGTTVTGKPSATKSKDEDNGEGNNNGAVLGNAIIILTMSVMACVINNLF
ncbi:membrane cofactor protein-like isoform X2 [Rhinoderma darwinii]